MHFDVAITSYRRPKLVEAAVRSCLVQGPLLGKVIVVDDASDDETPSRIRSIGDPRIEYLQRGVNGGIAAARADAFALSTAEWTVSLDSDHELLPGALESLERLSRVDQKPIDILGARYRWDTGEVTPANIPQYPICYRDRIELASREDSIGQDYLCAIRRSVREKVAWEPLRTGFPDTLFQLDIARVGVAMFSEQCLAIEKATHEHSHSRGTAKQRWARRLLDAKDGVKAVDVILQRHEKPLQLWGKPLLSKILTLGAFYALLSDRPRLARRWVLKAISYDQLTMHRLSILTFSFTGRKPVELSYMIRG